MHLLELMFLCGLAFALSRLDSLLTLVIFPFAAGPIAAYRVTPRLSSLVIGACAAVFWSLAAIVPFGLMASVTDKVMSTLDPNYSNRGVFLLCANAFFLVVSLVGGYIGGVVAKDD